MKCLICKEEFKPTNHNQVLCSSGRDKMVLETLYTAWGSERTIAESLGVSRISIRHLMSKFFIKPRSKNASGNPHRLGRKPWTIGLTIKTSQKLRIAVAKSAAKRRGRKQDIDVIKKRAEGIKRHYIEHPECKISLRQNGLKLAQSPYHHRRVPGEYTPSEESRQRISETLKQTYREHPEIRNIACEALKKARAVMRTNKSPSIPERKVGGLLSVLGIEPQSQYPFNGFALDFALPEQKLAILVDGCFWHCCPVHFPMATTKSQQHTLIVDARREKALQKAGWRILHVWEHEIKDSSILNYLRKEVMLAHEDSCN